MWALTYAECRINKSFDKLVSTHLQSFENRKFSEIFEKSRTILVRCLGQGVVRQGSRAVSKWNLVSKWNPDPSEIWCPSETQTQAGSKTCAKVKSEV